MDCKVPFTVFLDHILLRSLTQFLQFRQSLLVHPLERFPCPLDPFKSFFELLIVNFLKQPFVIVLMAFSGHWTNPLPALFVYILVLFVTIVHFCLFCLFTCVVMVFAGRIFAVKGTLVDLVPLEELFMNLCGGSFACVGVLYKAFIERCVLLWILSLVQ